MTGEMPTVGHDWFDMFTTNWQSPHLGLPNELNVDFELYGSVADAMAGNNRWMSDTWA